MDLGAEFSIRGVVDPRFAELLLYPHTGTFDLLSLHTVGRANWLFCTENKLAKSDHTM